MNIPRLSAYVLFAVAVVESTSSSLNNTVLCGQYDSYRSPSSPYTFSTNVWGADGSGSQCISITSNSTVFNATWTWSKNRSRVHAFPNIKLESEKLPLRLSELAQLNIAASWTVTPESEYESLLSTDIAANVVVDMFLDLDPQTAKSTTLPKYEIMIWFSAFGGRMPIGYNESIKAPPSHSLDGSEFKLYSGPNGNGQFVYSWLASSNISRFENNVSPLVHYLWQHNLISQSNYLGVVQFGTEEFHSSSNITFSARNFSLSAIAGQPQISSEGTIGGIQNLGWIWISLVFILALL